MTGSRYAWLLGIWLALTSIGFLVIAYLKTDGGTVVATDNLPVNTLLKASDLKLESRATVDALAGHYLMHAVAKGEALNMASVGPAPVFRPGQSPMMIALKIVKPHGDLTPNQPARLCNGTAEIATPLPILALQCPTAGAETCVAVAGFAASQAGAIAAAQAAQGADLRLDIGANCGKAKP